MPENQSWVFARLSGALVDFRSHDRSWVDCKQSLYNYPGTQEVRTLKTILQILYWDTAALRSP